MSKRILFDISIISMITLYILFYLEEHGANLSRVFLYCSWGLSTALLMIYAIIKKSSKHTDVGGRFVLVVSCISLVAATSSGLKEWSDYLDVKADNILRSDSKIQGTIYFEDPSSKSKPYIVDIGELGSLRILGYKVKLIDKDGILKDATDGDSVIISCSWLDSKKKSNYGQFNYIAYNKGNKITSAAAVKSVQKVKEEHNIYALRGAIVNQLNEKILMLTDVEPGLILGLFTGIKEGINRDVLTLFIATSTVHLLTVSGFHFALVFMVSDKLFKFVRIPRNIRLLLDIIIMVGYFFITPMKFSCLRALLMIIIYIISKLTCKKFDFLSALSFVVLLTILINPYGICDPSFIMTYLACIGIGLIYESLKDSFIKSKLAKPVKWLASSIVLTISIQLATSLYQSMSGGFINMLCPLFNIIVGLMVSAIMYMSLLGFTITFLAYDAPVSFIGKIIELSQGVLISTVGLFESFSYGVIDLAYIKSTVAFGFITFVFMLYLRVSFKRFRRLNVFIIPTLIITVSLGLTYMDKPQLTLIFNDVGQGDSEMFVTEKDRVVVIDTGDGKTDISSLVRYRGYTEVDYLILSHGHEDHSGGTEDLLSKINVKNIVIPEHMKDQISEILNIFNIDDTNVIVANSIMDITCDNSLITVIPTYTQDENLNNCSLVVSVLVDDLKILYTGDIESEVESLLINEDYIKDADIIKVPHHGSDTSSTVDFIASVRPKLGIIEVGENSYGHPNKGVLEEYENIGSKILRTDIEGQMILRYKNGNLRLKSFYYLK